MQMKRLAMRGERDSPYSSSEMSGNTLEDAKQKRQAVPGVKNFLTRVAILIALRHHSLADDFRTVGGKEYKNAAVSRVEPDGIVLRTK